MSITRPITDSLSWSEVFDSIDERKIIAPLQTVRKDGGTALGAIGMVERQCETVGMQPIRKAQLCLTGCLDLLGCSRFFISLKLPEEVQALGGKRKTCTQNLEGRNPWRVHALKKGSGPIFQSGIRKCLFFVIMC